MSESRSVNMTSTLLPFCVVFPLLCIAFSGCIEDGCQGALNAQSTAVHIAVVQGGWKNDAITFNETTGVITAPSLSERE